MSLAATCIGRQAGTPKTTSFGVPTYRQHKAEKFVFGRGEAQQNLTISVFDRFTAGREGLNQPITAARDGPSMIPNGS